MKTRLFAPLLASLLFGACAGNKTEDGKSLNDCPEIAIQQVVGNDSVTVLHLDKLRDTLDLPLSLLLDNFSMVPLDNREEALTKGTSVSAYDNYVGIGGSPVEPFKLFDHKGRLLCQVGANGRRASSPLILKSSGNEQLDQEAIRLIGQAPIKPAINKAKQRVRQTNWVIFVEFPPK